MPQQSAVTALATALRDEDVAYLHDAYQRNPIPVRLELPVADKADPDSLLMLRVPGRGYSVGLILICLLVVGQFGSYTVPLIIMAPIPLTIIGVLPGHALLDKAFAATSMIGMIALAGIIVRNSILLVDFIRHEAAAAIRGGGDPGGRGACQSRSR